MAITTFVANTVLTATQLNDSFTTASGMQFIASQTIGSAVSSVTVSSAFSTTYDNYYINITGGVGSTSAACRLTLGSTSTNYYQSFIYMSFGSTVVTGANGAAGYWLCGYSGTNNIDCNFSLQGPNLAKNTLMSYSGSLATTTGENASGRGLLDNTTQYTAFTVTPASGTLTGGTIRIYGYKNS